MITVSLNKGEVEFVKEVVWAVDNIYVEDDSDYKRMNRVADRLKMKL